MKSPSVATDESQLCDKLTEAGFNKTQFVTDTGTVWVNLEKKRHLIVPNSFGGFYPSWMLDQLISQANIVGDETLVKAITGLGVSKSRPIKKRNTK